jgi:hypothetical protein
MIKAASNISTNNESSTDDSELSTDDDCNAATALPVIRRKTKNISRKPMSSKPGPQLSNNKITIDQIPVVAKRVLAALNQCKKIVKYVKKVSNRWMLS